MPGISTQLLRASFAPGLVGILLHIGAGRWEKGCGDAAAPAPPSPPAAPCDLDAIASDGSGDHSCRSRIEWLKTHESKTEDAAKHQVCEEFPAICGPCCAPTPPPGGDGSGTDGDGKKLDTKKQLKVMSYNVLYSALDIQGNSCRLRSSGYKGDPCAQHEEIRRWNPDLIGTQELGPDSCAEMLSAKAGPSFKKAEGGESLLYNSNTAELIPKTNGHEALKYCDQWACRAFGWAKYKMKGEDFVFWHFNIHMTHEHGNPKGYQGKIAERMLEKYKEVSPCGEAVVMTGDWNPHKDMLEDKMPWSGGVNTAEQVLVSRGLKMLEKPGPQQDGDICKYCDRIFYTQKDFDLVEHQTGKRAGSDHTPHIATLRPKRKIDCHVAPSLLALQSSRRSRMFSFVIASKP